MEEKEETEKVEKPRRWMTIKEAAEYLDVSEQTVYRWMREGVITYYKIGESTKFRPEDLDAVVRKHTSYIEAERVLTRCPRCGHSDLTEGRIQSTGRIYFRPKKVRFFTVHEPMVELEARVCPRCGYVLLFADTEKMKVLSKKEKNVVEG